MSRTTITVTTEIDLDIDTAAKWFAALDDDQQCKFLVAVAAEMEKWPLGGDSQLYYIGGHLRHCECSTDAAREMVKNLARYTEISEHGKPLKGLTA